MNAPEHALERHRWAVAEYHRMAESGMFAPDARIELIDNVLPSGAEQPVRRRHV